MKIQVKKLSFFLNSSCLKDGQYKVHENSVIKPKSVYGKTKIKAEKIIKQFCIKIRLIIVFLDILILQAQALLEKLD